MKRVGILAGTFDPVHKGHLGLAAQALDVGGLDKVFLLPEPRPRRKQGVRALSHRLNMAELAAASHPKIGVIRLEHPQFSVHETLPVLQARFSGAELYMIMGDDVLAHLAEWPGVIRLLKETSFILAARQTSPGKIHEKMQALSGVHGVDVRFSILSEPLNSASSQAVRSALRAGMHSDMVSPEVTNYIKAQKLYYVDSSDSSSRGAS